MIEDYILNPEITDFIKENAGLPLHELALKLHNRKSLPSEFIINQVNGIQRLKYKLPEWQSYEGLVFPAKVSLEQCSSMEASIYKSDIIPDLKSVVDLTGGFGVDAYYFSLKADEVIYVEKNLELYEIVTHNYKVLKAAHITTQHNWSERWLESNCNRTFDLIYLDPARRGDHNEKLYKIEDCEPNVAELLPRIFKCTHQVMIKFSPLIDLHLLMQQLKHIKEIHIVSVKNECKEVLAILENDYSGEAKIVTADIHQTIQRFEFVGSDFLSFEFKFSNPLLYLYEPNASVMKSQGFGAVSERYDLYKLSPNSHLFTSTSVLIDFPGRVFKVIGTSEYSEKAFRRAFNHISKANVTVRNFGETTDQVKKKLKLKDGGSVYIFATSTVSQKRLLIICEKL